jgi:hypothetical protein
MSTRRALDETVVGRYSGSDVEQAAGIAPAAFRPLRAASVSAKHDPGKIQELRAALAQLSEGVSPQTRASSEGDRVVANAVLQAGLEIALAIRETHAGPAAHGETDT